MNYYSDIDTILSGIGLPYYNGMPVLSGEPDEYIVYDVYDTPNTFADDEETALSVVCTIAVISNALDVDLYEKIKSAMKKSDWTYQQSRDLADTDLYPIKKQHTIEFQKNYDMEE